MPAGYDICIVEDCPDTRRLVAETLRRAGFSVRTASDGLEAWELLTREPPKVVLSDWQMPRLDGLALCHRLRGNPDLADTFFVLMTAHDREGSKTLALCEGADDYLIKPPDLEELIARMRVGTRMWAMQEKLRQAAITDGLTGLYNHDHLNHVLEHEINRSRRYGGALSFLMIDVDCFKAVNDSYGHLVGNTVLQQVARTLRGAVRDVDSIGRFGGDEFAVVAPEATWEDAAIIGERIREGIASSVRLGGVTEAILSVSIGVSSTDDIRVKSAADLVNLADQAMYVAKRGGRNRVATAREVVEEEGSPESLIQTEEVNSLRKRVAVLSVQAKEIYMQSIASLVQALDERDPYTARHSMNVAFFAGRVARHMGCGESTVAAIQNAGLMHDIGKVGIPDRILMKPATLSALERAVMKQVPLISVRIVDHLRILEAERQIIRHQREYFDGSGVPDGLRGDAIPIGARIVLVADAFDAMTTDRVYRPHRTVAEALQELQREAGRQFDPRAVLAVRQLLERERPDWQWRIDDTIREFPAMARMAAH